MRDDKIEAAKIYLEIWKKNVEVQQHFNDLELKIRNFAVLIVGALLALGGYALKDKITVEILGKPYLAAGVIILTSLIPLIAFYFMDRFWYHRLLAGSVSSGQKVEEKLLALGFEPHLGDEISKSSPFEWWLPIGKKIIDRECNGVTKRVMHSKHKMDLFYSGLAASILIISITLLCGSALLP